MLSLLAGPRPLGVDTSADAFLRRAGLAQSLAAQYRSRLSHHWARYELWLIVPLAFLGRKASSSGFVRRFLQVWVGVTVLGLVAALVTDQIPGLRTLSFAFALPILAALGLSRAWGRFRPLAAWALVAALAAVLIFGSALTWFRERPYITDEQVAQMDQANSFIDATPLGTPLVFVVNENNPDLVSFHVTDWGNVIRASVPPDRIREVYLYVGTPQNAAALKPTLTGNSEHDTLSKLYLKDLLAGTRGKPAPLICFVPAFQSEAPSLPLPSQITCRANMATIISTPSEPWAIVLAGFEVFALLAFAGLGWSLAVLHGRFRVVALSPAFGAAAISLVAIAVDRLGFRLGNSATTTSVTAIAALSGYLAAWLRYRSGRRSDILAEQAGAGTQPPPEID
jgi:hypothetical protein